MIPVFKTDATKEEHLNALRLWVDCLKRSGVMPIDELASELNTITDALWHENAAQNAEQAVRHA